MRDGARKVSVPAHSEGFLEIVVRKRVTVADR
jgi:hypothetical protein